MRAIGQGAFAECGRLKRAVLNEGLEILGVDERFCRYDGHGVFQGSALEGVELPGTLRRIESCAFSECEGLRSVALPDGLEYVGEQCFSRSGLEEFVAPAGLRRLCSQAFSGCRALKRVVLNEGLRALGSDCKGVFSFSGVEEITFPSTLQEVGMHVFSNCDGLKMIYLKDGCQVNFTRFKRPR